MSYIPMEWGGTDSSIELLTDMGGRVLEAGKSYEVKWSSSSVGNVVVSEHGEKNTRIGARPIVHTLVCAGGMRGGDRCFSRDGFSMNYACYRNYNGVKLRLKMMRGRTSSPETWWTHTYTGHIPSAKPTIGPIINIFPTYPNKYLIVSSPPELHETSYRRQMAHYTTVVKPCLYAQLKQIDLAYADLQLRAIGLVVPLIGFATVVVIISIGASKCKVVHPVRRVGFSLQAKVSESITSNGVVRDHQLVNGNSFPNTGGFWMRIPSLSAEVRTLPAKNMGASPSLCGNLRVSPVEFAQAQYISRYARV